MYASGDVKRTVMLAHDGNSAGGAPWVQDSEVVTSWTQPANTFINHIILLCTSAPTTAASISLGWEVGTASSGAQICTGDITDGIIDAGADGLMIHSKSNQPDEISSFCKEYKKFDKRVPLIVVPSTYNHITEDELYDLGVNVVIYANHLLRSAYPSMVDTAKSILENKRSYEANDKCLPIKQVLKLIPDD